MTEKLFYTDAYLKEFRAEVISCEQVKNGWAVVLDRTAFYPEGGGQPADTGTFGGVKVLDVHERDGEIIHTADAPLAPGTQAEGLIDWPRRFSFMQNHTGEHIVSGWIHRLYGLDNVGFHMGRDAVTIDFNGELSAEALARVEAFANRAVWDNLAVGKTFPSPDALGALDFRSKKELSGAVRIVTVPGSDVCACCGLHVDRTGEVGPIKLLTAQRYKGGVRIWMLCGGRAMADYTWKNEAVYEISALLSAKPAEITPAVQRMCAENDSLKQSLTALRDELFAYKAAETPAGTACACRFEAELAPEGVRKFAMLLRNRCGVAAVFSRDGGEGWKYALASNAQDIRPLGKELNAAFSGRGGGSAEVVQGTLSGEQSALEAFFSARFPSAQK